MNGKVDVVFDPRMSDTGAVQGRNPPATTPSGNLFGRGLPSRRKDLQLRFGGQTPAHPDQTRTKTRCPSHEQPPIRTRPDCRRILFVTALLLAGCARVHQKDREFLSDPIMQLHPRSPGRRPGKPQPPPPRRLGGRKLRLRRRMRMLKPFLAIAAVADWPLTPRSCAAGGRGRANPIRAWISSTCTTGTATRSGTTPPPSPISARSLRRGNSNGIRKWTRFRAPRAAWASGTSAASPTTT